MKYNGNPSRINNAPIAALLTSEIIVFTRNSKENITNSIGVYG